MIFNNLALLVFFLDASLRSNMTGSRFFEILVALLCRDDKSTYWLIDYFAITFLMKRGNCCCNSLFVMFTIGSPFF